MVVELKKGVYWVGAVDWELRVFHGHELTTHRGSTYNSYLIVDEKKVLVDTVWKPFAEELLKNIREVIDPSKIDLVVTNHSEIDHAGSLPTVMRHCPKAEVVVSKMGEISVPGHFHENWKFRTVKSADRINIGASELVFIEAPMLHWPDSMFTYLTSQRILMPNDAFGQHYATSSRFNDEVDQNELYEEALKYYANILTPFSDRVLKKIEELLAMGLPVDMIAPSHGVIWRKEPLQIVNKYLEWAKQKPDTRAVVLYDTMWDATRHMAEAICDGFADAEVPCKLVNLSVSDRNDVIVDIFRSRTVLVGSSTINNGPLPTVLPILADIKGLKFKNKIGAAFGSYGWSGEAPKQLEELLRGAGVEIVKDHIKFKWQPTPEELEACRAFGREIAEITKKPCSIQ